MFHGLKVLNCAGFPSSGCLDREVDQPAHVDDVVDGIGECHLDGVDIGLIVLLIAHVMVFVFIFGYALALFMLRHLFR